MQSRWTLLTFVLVSFFSNAQYDSQGVNTTRFRPGFFWYLTGYYPASPEKVRKYDRLIFDVVYSDWCGDLKPFKNSWASIGFNTNIIWDIPLVKKNLISLGLGGCYGYSAIRHNKDILLNNTSDWTYILDSIPVGGFQRNSFSGHNFSIPIELRFRTKGWKHFKVHVGGKIGYQLGFKGKTRAEFLDVISKLRFSVPDYNRFTYSAHVRIGIRNWSIFASYNFNPLFSNSKSTQVNLLQLGVSISVF
jgi:hypothetical protein